MESWWKKPLQVVAVAALGLGYLFVECGGVAIMETRRCNNGVEEAAAAYPIADKTLERLAKAEVWQRCMERNDFTCDQLACNSSSGPVFKNPYR